jgi:hypothetical protein
MQDLRNNEGGEPVGEPDARLDAEENRIEALQRSVQQPVGIGHVDSACEMVERTEQK